MSLALGRLDNGAIVGGLLKYEAIRVFIDPLILERDSLGGKARNPFVLLSSRDFTSV